jgi:MFS family permease
MLRYAGFERILRALRNPNYGIYTAGNAISLIGTWMQRVAIGWLTWQLTESGAWLGIIAFADLFPSLIVSPIAGAAADRWDRLRVTRVSQAVSMLHSFVLFGLVAAGLITIELLLALTVILGVVVSFTQPARLALLPSLVPREDLSAAIAINSIIFNSARFIGPAVAGIIIVTFGIAPTFAVNTTTFAIFVFALSKVRLTRPPPVQSARSSFFADFMEGVRYTGAHVGIGRLILLLLVICLGVRPFVELLPGFAAAVFGAGAGGLALLTSTIGAGAVVGGLWLSQRESHFGLTRIVLGSALALCLSALLFVATDRLWVAVPALAVAGFAMVAGGVGTQTLIQHAVDESMRGRVLSLYGLTFRSGPAFGALAMGSTSEVVGLRWPLVAGAALAMLAWLPIAARWRAMTAAMEGGPAVTRRLNAGAGGSAGAAGSPPPP